MSSKQIEAEPSATKYNPQRPSTNPQLLQIGITDESEPLRTASVWGAIGVEAVIAQCYPNQISLFYQSFDVIAARQEGLEFAATLESHGVRVLMARDILAETLKPKTFKKTSVIGELVEKAEAIQSSHNTHIDNAAELINIQQEADIERYGEEKALNLNHTLSLSPQLPLGNSIYGRDQMNVLLGARVVSRMAKLIRRPEVSLYELIYKGSLAPHQTINIPTDETFEGGDAYVHQGHVWIGVGSRTSFGAAIKIYEALKPELDLAGLKFAVVQDEDPYGRPFSEQQSFMHLDTFSNPTGRRDIAVCLEEATRRKVKLLISSKGQTRIEETGLSFIDYLEHEVKEEEIVKISLEEQKEFGCNFLLLGKNNDGRDVILVPLENNNGINNQLRKNGKVVKTVELYESTRGYGAAHCMTGQLLREAYYG